MDKSREQLIAELAETDNGHNGFTKMGSPPMWFKTTKHMFNGRPARCYLEQDPAITYKNLVRILTTDRVCPYCQQNTPCRTKHCQHCNKLLDNEKRSKS